MAAQKGGQGSGSGSIPNAVADTAAKNKMKKMPRKPTYYTLTEPMKVVWQTLKQVHSPVTVGILAVNTLIYLYSMAVGPESYLLTLQFAAIPERILAAMHWIRIEGLNWENVEPLLTLFTATFLHGSEAHLGNNMLFFWIFGSLLERQMGRLWVPLLFLVCGAAGNLAQIYIEPHSGVPIIGASGAIAGLEAVYFVLAFKWELPWPHVWPIARPVPPKQLAAVAVVGFLFDVLSLGDKVSHIAYGAHVGGFLAGVTSALVVTTLWSGPRLLRPKSREI